MTTPHSPSQQRAGTHACDAILVGVVGVVAAIFAASMLAGYAAEPGQLWHDINHDRNGHFNFGLDLVLELKALDPLAFLQHIERARTWPPVHGLALASVMILGGIDLRLAILPSLFGWICTVVLAFLIARRLFTDRHTGIVAGAITVTFAMASPAFRLITADVMLEGLGAALTATCLYLYLRARAEPDRGYLWRALALALTVLFFEKSNYWVLTFVPLAIAYLSEDLHHRLMWCRAQVKAIDKRGIFRSVARDPAVIAAAVLIVLVVAIYAHGPTAVDIFGNRVSLYPPENLVTITWCVLFIRAMLLWRQHRAAFDAAIGLPGRSLFYWHALPIAVSFLMPKRLSTFLWYVGRTHHLDDGPRYDLMQALASQWLGFSQGFHVVPWIAALVLALAAIAVTRLPRLAPGARAIAILAALSAAAVILHPQQQWRFQSTWLFAVWILAGAGGAIVLSWLTTRLPGIARGCVAVATVLTVAAVESRYTWTDTAYAAASRSRTGPNDLDLAKAYLPHVADAKMIGFMATFPRTGFFAWSVREHCRCRVTIEMPWLSPLQTREDYRRDAANWLAHTYAERFVSIDAPGLYEIPELGLTHERLSGILDAIANDPGFERVATEPVPTLGATVTIWRRR